MESNIPIEIEPKTEWEVTQEDEIFTVSVIDISSKSIIFIHRLSNPSHILDDYKSTYGDAGIEEIEKSAKNIALDYVNTHLS